MKLIVETTGSFQIHGLYPEQWAHHDRPSVVAESNFMGLHIHNGAVKILAQVADTATDADFFNQWQECKPDVELAVENYVSQHPLVAAEPAAPRKRTTKV